MVSLRSVAVALFGVAATVKSCLGSFDLLFSSQPNLQTNIPCHNTAHSTQRNPLTYVSLLENPVLLSSSHHVHAYSSFDLTFYLHSKQQKVRLSLEPNHDVIHDTLHVHYLGADGTVKYIEPVDRAEHKVFKGSAFIQHAGHTEWTNVGWARITVHRDGKEPIFEGAFRIDHDHHHIQTGFNYQRLRLAEDPVVNDPRSNDEYMIVWRDSDIMEHYLSHDELKRDVFGRSSCSSDNLDFNAAYSNIELRDLQGVSSNSLFSRQEVDGTTGNNGAGVNLIETIGSTNGCPTTRKVALVGIATDCTYTAAFNSSQAARTNIIQQVNAASQVYESTFNISLGIRNLTISEPNCPAQASSAAPWNVACSPNVDITDRLNLFSAWRGLSRDGNAYWTLLSTCNTDSAVGLAWLGQVCVEGAQAARVEGGGNETIASANVVIRTATEWQVFAHETGHTFGAVHDCTSSSCGDGSSRMQRCCPFSTTQCDAGGGFIMNPSTGSGIRAFSPCSIGNICSAIGRSAVRTQCLTNNKDVTTITGSQCGNGIVESGEDCDCGGEQGCSGNPCCNPTTCKFTTNSVCDPSNEDCCTPRCQFASAGTVCRQSSGFCDPQETCSGTSPMCPRDVHRDDGTSCGDSGQGLTCASGQCTSRNQQCKTLIGVRTNRNDTYACSNRGCLLSCSSPQFGPDMCVALNQNFLDGTPCEGGGKCNNGQCQGSSVANEIGQWINDNKNIFIPVVSVVGGLILIALLCCCYSSIQQRRRKSKRKKGRVPKPPAPPMNEWAAYGGGFNQAQNIPRPQRAARGPPPPPEYRNYPEQWQPGTTLRYA
jgi:hypothetical protein